MMAATEAQNHQPTSQKSERRRLRNYSEVTNLKEIDLTIVLATTG